MITIFNGQTRSLGKSQKKNIYAQIDVTMRQKLNQFKEPTDFMVFMCIALHANADGWAWPKIGSIAIETGLSEKTISHSVKRLHETLIDGERVLLAYQPRDNGGKLQAYRYLLMPDAAEVRKYEQDEKVSRLAKANMATTPPSMEGGKQPPPNEPPVVEPPVVEGGVVNHYSSIRKEEPEKEAPKKEKPQVFPAIAEISNGASPNQNPTQPLQEEKEVEQKANMPPAAAQPVPVRAPAPPTGTRKPDPEQVRRADDLLQRHIAHKDGGKLTNWDITRRALDKAIKSGPQEDKAAIEKACNELSDTISEIVNDYQWRFWRDKRQALQIIALDLTLDAIAAYVRADCDNIAQKQKDREGYGIGDALQAVRIALAAQNGPPKKAEMREEQYEDPVTGEIRLRWME